MIAEIRGRGKTSSEFTEFARQNEAPTFQETVPSCRGPGMGPAHVIVTWRRWATGSPRVPHTARLASTEMVQDQAAIRVTLESVIRAGRVSRCSRSEIIPGFASLASVGSGATSACCWGLGACERRNVNCCWCWRCGLRRICFDTRGRVEQ